MAIPDPSILLSALDTIAEKAMKKDHRRQFRVESARSDLKVDIVTTFEAVEQLSIILVGTMCFNKVDTGNSQDYLHRWKSKRQRKKWERR